MKLERLGNICDLQNGYAFKSSDYIEHSNTLCCRMSNIRPDSKFDIDYNPKYLPDNFKVKYKEFVLKDGDIIIAMTDMATDPKILGVPTQVETKGHTLLLNQRVGKLFNFNLDKVCLPYIKVALGRKDLKEYYKRFSGGGIQLNISKENILNIQIPLPLLSDQIRIAEILSQAESLIAQRKQSISLLDELLKSTFLEMFGDPVKNEKEWEMMSGEKYLDKLTVGVVIKPASHYVDKGIIALRSLNIKPNRIDLNNLVYFSKESNEKELAKSILRTGDVVFVRTGVTGTAAIIPKELDGCNCIDLIITRPKEKTINPKYLVFFFNSDIGKRIVLSKQVGGIQQHFNIGAMKSLRIPIPPLDLQTKFANIVEKVEALKTQYQQSLTELENMYGVLSQKAFKGELNIKQKEKVS